MLLIVYFLETVTLVVPQTLFSLYISLQPKYGLNNAVVYNYAFFLLYYVNVLLLN